MSEDTLRQELESAFANRADLYRLMLSELSAELGPRRRDSGAALPRRRRIRQGPVRNRRRGLPQ